MIDERIKDAMRNCARACLNRGTMTHQAGAVLNYLDQLEATGSPSAAARAVHEVLEPELPPPPPPQVNQDPLPGDLLDAQEAEEVAPKVVRKKKVSKKKVTRRG